MSEWISSIKPLYGTPLNYGHWAAQGLVGCWLFNEGSGDKAYDYSGQGNTGTLTGMSPMSATSGWVPGPHGGALAFDGSDDYVDCGQAGSALISNFTLLTWIRGTTANCRILSRRGVTAQWDFHTMAANGNLALYAGGVTYNSGKNITDNVHHLVAVSISGSQSKFFVDGQKVGGDFSPSISIISTNTYIGKYGSSYWSGLISSVSIYNRALSAQEIAYLYAFPYCMFEESRKIFYSLPTTPPATGCIITNSLGAESLEVIPTTFNPNNITDVRVFYAGSPRDTQYLAMENNSDVLLTEDGNLLTTEIAEG